MFHWWHLELLFIISDFIKNNIIGSAIVTHKEERVYDFLVALGVFLLIVMPIQIKIFWYGLRIVLLLSIILFLTYTARNTDKENKDIIIFKVYFWLGILIYFMYRQYSISNVICLSVCLIGYIIILFLCFVYGKKIKWKNSIAFLIIESGAFIFMILDILKVSLMP